MCTVTWAHQPDGYHLLCNRDEKRTRGAALAPLVFQKDKVRYIAPIDGDCGGTWLAANQFGVSLCLLNGDVQAGPEPDRSRGLLVREFAPSRSLDRCMARLKRFDPKPYAPFFLLVLEPKRPAVVAQWDGSSFVIDCSADARLPLSSSSFDASGARWARSRMLKHHVRSSNAADPASLYAFHASHGESPSAYSPCMHREDAQTVSFSWVVVSRDEVRFLYSPVAPCQSAPSAPQILRRTA